ncbi:hypothetical protein PCANC_10574 [Puccinia coronata f. sp. avenae]|uniref:Uncharacterized protein n=1 Tax=Puccinia coronata f. sp. avenae TaxID=200324 RepID=A0A2N5VRA7_9BASI|nr:hypothetical protein PCANC_10574 [Puccinia coronata f. sp. avenae]
MPRDPHTLVKKAAIKPHLVETVCCRICFHLYSFEQQRLPPTFCQYKRFANSDPCSEELWVQKSTHSGIKDLGQFPRPSKKDYPAKFGVPRCLYVSQPILAWLELLLRKPDIEAAIDAWASKVLNSKAELMDVQHGTTFQKLSQVDTPILHLLTPPTASQVYLPSCCCRRTPSGYERLSVHDPLAPTGSELADSHQVDQSLRSTRKPIDRCFLNGRRRRGCGFSRCLIGVLPTTKRELLAQLPHLLASSCSPSYHSSMPVAAR